MKLNPGLNPHSAGCFLTLILGAAGGMAVAPGMAQPSSEVAPEAARVQLAQSSSALQGDWRLTNMTAPGSPMPMLPASQNPPTAAFAGDRISGFAGCNNFTGNFNSRRGQLSVGELATTRQSCEPAVMNQESTYLAALRAAERYEVNRQRELTISYRTRQGQGVLRFVQDSSAQNPPRPTPPPSQNTPPRNGILGRGVAQGSAFTQGRSANAVLVLDRDNFSLELSEPTSSGSRGQTNPGWVQYRGAVVRRQDDRRSGSNSFTLEARVRSFDSSLSLRVVTNTTGTCRIEVFDSRVVSSSCRTAADNSNTQFLGVEQF